MIEGNENVVEMLQSGRLIKIAAPMVRYSKYGADVCYSPMIMADSFVCSQTARDHEFQLCAQDRPLVLQLAAHNADEFARAVELLAGKVAGVDLNCGCPQSWALAEGIGAAMMRNPELIREMIRQAWTRTSGHTTSISVKMRIFSDNRKTVDFARILEAVGVSWITVHGRTAKQRPSDPVDYTTIKLVRESLNIPVVANGNVTSLEEAHTIRQLTGTAGIMVARGLLANPALFAGHTTTPWQAVDRFVRLSLDFGTNTAIFHRHLSKMTVSLLPTHLHRLLTSETATTMPAILDFLEEHRPLRDE